MHLDTPGRRIRAKRDEMGLGQVELARLVGLTEGAINKIEVGTMAIGIIGSARLQEIADKLKTTAEYIRHGEFRSETSTREELLKMRQEGMISDEELERLDKLAKESIRLRNNAKIPLNRNELVALLEVVRGADGYWMRG